MQISNLYIRNYDANTKYDIGAPLGVGGQGSVYQAFKKNDMTLFPFALKII